ncbi:hypothetical protein Q4595_00205 [Wenyingzhuangia sp. 1_MG-2023]|nr:hypothetical protein [Wenyingzhuangia sp. 1_MG-2023]
MKKKGFIILGIVLVVLTIVLENITPEKVIWQRTYHENETNPYDLKVFYDQLDTLFYQEKLVTLKNTFYEFTEEDPSINYQQNNTYINIDDGFFPDKTSEDKLLAFIGNGNTAFISANQFSSSLLNSLKIVKNFKGKNLMKTDSLTLSFVQKPESLTYKAKLKFYQNYFKDSSNIKSLGKIAFKSNDTLFEKINFIEIPFKKGLVYLHTQPEIFTNYYLLETSNTKYINQLLSYIPTKVPNSNINNTHTVIQNGSTSTFVDNSTFIYFESNYKTDADISNSPLRFIKKQKELYWAWWLLLIGVFLFFIINAKRKQRIIPILPKVRNTSMDFVETIALLYEEADNFQPIVQQKIHIFFKNIRHTYNIVTDKTNPKLVEQLSLKSGYDKQKTKELIRFINVIKTRETSSIELLTRLNKEIEDFYKNTNAWKN